jgi:hypothetical protein
VTEEEQTERKKIHFDGTVTAGNILTAIGMISALIVWGVSIEGRIAHESDLRVRIEKRIDEVEARSGEGANELKMALRRIEDKLDNAIGAGRMR